MLKDVKYEYFQMDLSELDCLYENNPNIMNYELKKKINKTAGKSLKNIESNNKIKRNIKAGEIKMHRRTSKIQQNLKSHFKKEKVTN